MGLNLSNRQIALELGLDSSDTQAMTEQLRRGLAAKTPAVEFPAHDHVAQLAILVGFTGLERLAVDHGHRRQEPSLQPLQLP